MKKAICFFTCLTIVFAMSLSACDAADKASKDSPENDNLKAVPSESNLPEINTSEISTGHNLSSTAFSRKYLDEVYNIHIASQIVGREACDEWTNNVFLKKSPAEQEELPPLYQIITELDITKEELIHQNTENGNELSETMIEALYIEDINTMKQLLKNPFALYHNGNIYTFNELITGAYTNETIPRDVVERYFDFISVECEIRKMTKYVYEDINRARKANGLSEKDGFVDLEIGAHVIFSDDTNITVKEMQFGKEYPLTFSFDLDHTPTEGAFYWIRGKYDIESEVISIYTPEGFHCPQRYMHTD